MTETDEALAREWLAEDEGPYVGEMDNVGYHRARKAVEDTRVDLLASLLQRIRTEERQRAERIVDGSYPPKAQEYRDAEGNSKTLDRYWMGWVDCLDEIIRRLREG